MYIHALQGHKPEWIINRNRSG